MALACEWKARDRKRTESKKYRALTLGLWFGLEFTGTFVGAWLMQLLNAGDNAFYGAYFLGIIGAAIGGFTSYWVAKKHRWEITDQKTSQMDGIISQVDGIRARTAGIISKMDGTRIRTAGIISKMDGTRIRTAGIISKMDGTRIRTAGIINRMSGDRHSRNRIAFLLRQRSVLSKKRAVIPADRMHFS